MDKSIRQASAFLERANVATDYSQRLFCLYDALVCLYGPFHAQQEASLCLGISASVFKNSLESAREDSNSEGQKVKLTPAQLEILTDFIQQKLP